MQTEVVSFGCVLAARGVLGGDVEVWRRSWVAVFEGDEDEDGGLGDVGGRVVDGMGERDGEKSEREDVWVVVGREYGGL